MAQKATPENVAADMAPPNYRAAVQRIRTIKAKKDKVAGVNGEIADVWAKVEGHKVNKGAGKDFLRLDGMEHEDRVRYMRDLNGLIDAAGWDETAQDMVDKAENKVVHMRFGKEGEAPEVADGDEAGPDDPNKDALTRAREHLGAAGDDDAMLRAGDSTDLSDHSEAAE